MLELEALEIIGPIPKTNDGNLFVIVITVRIYKTTQEIPVAKTKAPYVEGIYLDKWIITNGITTYLLNGYGPQLLGKFSAPLCSVSWK